MKTQPRVSVEARAPAPMPDPPTPDPRPDATPTDAARPAATAAGTLGKTPLLHLLVYALDTGLTGTLEFGRPSGTAGATSATSVAAASIAAAIVFVGGEPVKARTSEPGAYLGRVLLELGHLNEDQLTRSLAALARAKASAPTLHGELLRASGIVDESAVHAGLREQVARTLRRIAALGPSASYAYYDRFDGLHGWGGALERGFDPIPMLWGMLRESPPWDHVRAGLARVGGSPLRLGPRADVARLGLNAEPRKAVEMLRIRPLTTGELAEAAGLSELDASLLTYLLLATRQVDLLPAPATAPTAVAQEDPRSQASPQAPSPLAPSVPQSPSLPPSRSPFPESARSPVPASVGAPQSTSTPSSRASIPAAPVATGRPDSVPPPGSPSGTFRPPALSVPGSTPPPGPPPSLSPLQADRWREIVDRAKTIDRHDYFAMLDIERSATKEDIDAVYLGLAKKWHPDRLPSELAPVRDACSRVFGRMSEAHATLTDESRRRTYMLLLAEGTGSPEMQESVARVIEAATTFQKAEVCFRRNDLAQAEILCRKAVTSDPTQAEYHALLAWLVAIKPESQSAEKTAECIQMLDRAIALNERCEKAYLWRGLLQKRAGRTESAFRDFRRAVELNPRNIDAAREVRLYQMRGGRRSSPPSGARAATSSSRPPGSNPPPPRTDTPQDGAAKPGLFGRLFKKS